LPRLRNHLISVHPSLPCPSRPTGVALLILTLAASALAQNSAEQLLQQHSPGSAIQSAAEAAAQNRPREGAIDILSDTEGVDFGPYLKDVLVQVRQNWYRLIPADAELKKGRVAIEFRILKSGEVRDMKLVASAGTALDRPACLGVTASNPFRPLPEAFHGPYIALRFRYFYNPDKPDLEDRHMSDSGQTEAKSRFQHAVLIQDTADSHPIKYPSNAVREKADGIVRLVAQITPNGAVRASLRWKEARSSGMQPQMQSITGAFSRRRSTGNLWKTT
jgi:hypothetical protein